MNYPYKRYAVRCLHRDDKSVSWFTDDGTGTDEAIDYTEWDDRCLVVYIDKAEAKWFADDARAWAKVRKMTLRVVAVWEYPNGEFRQRKGSI